LNYETQNVSHTLVYAMQYLGQLSTFT